MYSRGESGSPVIALRAALETNFSLNVQLVFRFIELDPDRAQHLEDHIKTFDLPSHFDWMVVRSSFEDALRADLKSGAFKGTPTFAFIDPFGFSGLPFGLIRELLENPVSEVLITFMKSFAARFTDVTPEAINDTIGDSTAAQQLLALPWNERLQRARQLYHASLSRAAKYVRFFEMRDDRGVPIYDLFFASNHSLGHYKMKVAMWKADKSGAFCFSDGVDPDQLTLFSDDPALKLAECLSGNFQGTTVYSEEVLKHVQDATAYLDEHTRAALKVLEDLSRITADDRKRDGKPRRKRTYPEGARITFSG